MTRFLFVSALCFLSLSATLAQTPFLGVQNGPRKGMYSAIMNPAEITSLSRKVDVNLFSTQVGISNDVLTFQDILNETDLLDYALEKADGPINLRADVSVLGPSVGFSIGKWSFGVATQGVVKADIVNLDESIANGLLGDSQYSWVSASEISRDFSSTDNQRIMAAGWAELDFLVGRELFAIGAHHFAAGANLRLIFPSLYANMGLGTFRGTVIEDEQGVYLSDTRGDLNIAYSDVTLNDDLTYQPASLSGFAVDLGGNYQWKKPDGSSFIHAGLAVKNLGGMSFGSNATNRSYSVNIPTNQRFRIDNLEGDLDEIEAQLVQSGYFTIDHGSEELSANLPTLINLYGEISPVKVFHASLFIQRRLSNEADNQVITAQNMIVLTPRLVLGSFQIYSPWAHNQISGLTGGLGIQVGGFFIGSNALLTGTLANSMQADFHMGFSFGIGKK